jgi:hypothetical protein
VPRFRTGYLPSVHGFSFHNGFRRQDLGSVFSQGLSHGLCAVSLDYFHIGRPAPAIEVVDFGVRPASGLAVASWLPDQADLFARYDHNAIATKHLAGGRSTSWQEIRGVMSSAAPAVTSSGPDRIDLLVRGAGGTMQRHWYDGGWVGPADNGAVVLGSGPAVTTLPAGGLEAYANGLDGEVGFAYHDGAWHWTSLGRPPGVRPASEPAAASQPGWTMVLVTGSDQRIWQRERVRDRWQPWGSLGGRTSRGPAIASAAPGQAQAYLRGQDGDVHINILAGGKWQGWTSLGAPPPGLADERPAAMSHPGLMNVYALAKDHTVWHKRWSSGWRPWLSVEATVPRAAHLLVEAVRNRQAITTTRPLLDERAGETSAGLFVRYAGTADDALLHQVDTRELPRLLSMAAAGTPVSIGLLGAGDLAHEVVVFGGEVCPGATSTLDVYDPNHPRDDQVKIVVDVANRTLRSSTGETWRALWVRDDIGREEPPI